MRPKRKCKQHKPFNYGSRTAIQLDGATIYGETSVLIPTLTGGSYSVSAWIYFPAGSVVVSFEGLISHHNVAGGNKVVVLMNLGTYGGVKGRLWGFDAGGGSPWSTMSASASDPLNDQVWHNVIWTYNPTTNAARGYIDGVLQITGGLNTNVAMAADDQLSLGQEWDGAAPSDLFEGQFMNVAYWDRILSATEAATIGTGSPGSNLQGMPAGGPLHYYSVGNGDPIPVCIDRGPGKVNITWPNAIASDIVAGSNT